MKVVADDSMGDWLEIEFDRQSLDWDDYNIPKLSKHHVTKEEINALFENDFFFVGRILEPEGISFGEKRYLMLGVIPDGRHFAIVCTRREDKIRPISCRRMVDKERAVYESKK